MAITPSQWSHVLVIPESYTPSAPTSGQTLVITESVIAKLSAGEQSTFWSNVQNGGGDVRICTDAGGVNQLPVEIVSLDNVAQTCVIWTRKPTYNGTGNLYVFIGKAGETQPAVTDPFGRNAVWADYIGIYNLSDGTAIDSSGGNDLTESGTPSVVSGKIGNATRFDSSADSFDGAFSGLGNTKRTLSLWVNPDDVTQNRYLSTFNGGGKSNLTAMLLGFQSGQFNAFDEGYPTGNASQTQIAATDLTWQHICYSWDGSRLKGYLNGELVVDVADTLNPATPNFLSITPASGGGSNFYTGNLQYFGARNSGIEPNEIATEYANQNDPATFFGTPTISTTGGGGAVTANVAFALNTPTFLSSASATLPQPIANGAFSIASPSFNAGANASLPQPIADAAFTLNAPTFSANASATIPSFSASVAYSVNAPTFTADATVTLPSPTADAAFSLPAPSFAASATATEPSFNASVNFALPATTFSAYATATLPQPIADGNFTITAPAFSVVAIVGGIAIIVEDETNINTTTLSNNLTVPPLSNNIDL